MKVALITDGITPYVIGGMQKHSFYLAKYLARQKVQVDLFHYNAFSLDISKLNIFSEEEKAYITSHVLQFPTSARFPGHYMYRSYRYSAMIYDLILPKLDSYDFIYTKGFAGWKLIQAKHAGRISCCDIGVKFHGYEMFQAPPSFKSRLQRQLLRLYAKSITLKADKVFSYGGKITSLIRSLGVLPERIIELPSGIEANRISPAPSAAHTPVHFVFMGRYERRKGIEELHAVIAELLNEPVDFRFSFIGPVPEARQIKHAHITYHGEIREADRIQDLLRGQDVLVCPSWSEGFPNVILEGMGCGLAIIATDTGAVKLMVSSANGRLIEPGDKAALKQSILELCHSSELQTYKAESLKLINQKFNWDIIAKDLISKLH